MGEYSIVGGKRLMGEVRVQGSKNSVLPILAAAVLNASKSVIHNFPKIADTDTAVKILEEIGCLVQIQDDALLVDSSSAKNFEISEQLVQSMRSSIVFIGSLLARFGAACVSYPGGCELGLRPIDLHLKALRMMGASIVEEHGFIICRTEGLVGADINLDFPSVGATENIMLAATLAKGTTTISNAAKEPEIVDLSHFLNTMGAVVKGAGSSTIVIHGVPRLGPAEHLVMPDRIAAGTYLVAAAITAGDVTLRSVSPKDLRPVLAKLQEAGCTIEEKYSSVRLKREGKLQAIKLRTLPHPGFPTDMQPQFCAMLSIADGISIIEETLFESRNKHIPELHRMGADIVLAQDAMTSIIRGGSQLSGSRVASKDLRGGAALVLAGLAATGHTIVSPSAHILRGYERLDQDLSSLGADIRLTQ